MKPFNEVMKDMRAGFKKLTPAQQASTAAQLAGQEAMSGLLAIVQASDTDYDKLSGSIANCDGTSQKMADTMNNNLKGQIVLLKSQLEGVGIQLGQVLIPVAKDFISTLSKWVDWFSKLSPGTQEALIKMTAFGLASGGAFKIIGGGISTVAKVTGGIGKLAGIIGKFSGVAATTTTVVEGVAGATSTLGTAASVAGAGTVAAEGGLAAFIGTIGGVALPITLAVGAIAGLGYGAYKLKQHLDKEVSPSIDLFADKVTRSREKIVLANGQFAYSVKETTTKISEATKKTVGEYMKLDKEASAQLMDLRVNSDVFTQTAKNSVIKNFSDMGKKSDKISKEMKGQMTADFQKLVTDTGLLTDKNKKNIIEKYTQMVQGCSSLTAKQKADTIKKFTDTLNKSTEITNKQRNDILKTYKDMGDKIKSGLDKSQKSQLKGLTDFFAKTNALTDQEEVDILNKTNKAWEDKKKTIDDKEKQINDILKKASDEHRSLTDAEAKSIKEIQNQMKVDAVKCLSEQKVESELILTRIKDSDEHLTAETASNHIKELNKCRDKSIESAKKECDDRIKQFINARDVTGTLTAEQAEKCIKAAEKQRDDTIKAAEETRNQSVEKITSMDSNISKDVNTTTGNVITNWDKLKSWWDNWNPVAKSLVVGITKAISPGLSGEIDQHWTGSSHFKGGLTTLHERGYELYDLPDSTRIYNHESSEELVKQTAENVANKVLSGFGENSNYNVTQNFYNPVNDPSELSRKTKNALRELSLNY